jgi:hypothetical protein
MFKNRYKEELQSLGTLLKNEIETAETFLYHEKRYAFDPQRPMQEHLSYLMGLKDQERSFWSGFVEFFPSAVAVLDPFQKIINANTMLQDFLHVTDAQLKANPSFSSLVTKNGTCSLCDFIKSHTDHQKSSGFSAKEVIYITRKGKCPIFVFVVPVFKFKCERINRSIQSNYYHGNDFQRDISSPLELPPSNDLQHYQPPVNHIINNFNIIIGQIRSALQISEAASDDTKQQLHSLNSWSNEQFIPTLADIGDDAITLESSIIEISSIIGLIKDISDQTNLLALNAAIRRRVPVNWARFCVLLMKYNWRKSQKSTSDIEIIMKSTRCQPNGHNVKGFMRESEVFSRFQAISKTVLPVLLTITPSERSKV